MSSAKTMDNEELIHNLVVDSLRQKLKREYEEITVNSSGSPDVTLINHGLTLAAVEVETEGSITPEKAEKWKFLSQQNKLILMVPKHTRVKVTELLWQKGIGDRVKIGTYEIAINMP